MKNNRIGMCSRAQLTTLVLTISITVLAWITVSSIALAQTTPPPLPQPFQWDRDNIGKHWINAESLQDVQDAFNIARAAEIVTLAGQTEYRKIAEMDLANTFTLSEWLSMSIEDRALWLINDARTARGLTPYEGIDPVLNEITADYAQFLLDNDANGHSADGGNALVRYTDHPQSDESCPTYVQESLSYSGSTSDGTLATFPIAVAVYNWVHAGTSGHRESMLYQGDVFMDDTGVIGAEGNIGIGLVEGSGYGAFNGIFDTNVQIVVYTHYETSRVCDSIPAVPPAQNSVIINEIDYATEDSPIFVEFYNSGLTSQALRHYTLDTGSEMIALPTIAIQPDEYVVICGPSIDVNNCTYELRADVPWGDEARLLLNGEVVDTVSLSGDVASEPGFGISRHGDTWLPACATLGAANGTRNAEIASCDAPQIVVSQSADIDTFDTNVDVTYTIILTSDINVDVSTDLINGNGSNESGYDCSTITTQVLGNGLTQGLWTCTVSYSLESDVCVSNPVHEVTIITGDDPIVDELGIELVCNDPPAPAAFSAIQAIEESSTGVLIGTQGVAFLISATNTGGTPADLTLSTTPNSRFQNHTCSAETQTVAPGETAVWRCSMRVSLIYDVCQPEITHIATLTSPDLDAPIVTTAREEILCFDAPIEIEAEQTVSVITGEDDVALLSYDVTFNNIGSRDALFTLDSAENNLFTTYECDQLTSNVLMAGESLTVICTATVSISHDNCTDVVNHTIMLTAESAVLPFPTALDTTLACNSVPLAITLNNSAVMSNSSMLLTIVLVTLMLGASLPITLPVTMKG